MLKYLQKRSPFTPDASLRNISTGVSAHSTVNADNARYVGNAILVSMEGKTVEEYTFKRKNQAVTLDTKSSVKIGGDAVQNSYFSILQWLQWPVLIWKVCSSMSFAASHLPYWIHQGSEVSVG